MPHLDCTGSRSALAGSAGTDPWRGSCSRCQYLANPGSRGWEPVFIPLASTARYSSVSWPRTCARAPQEQIAISNGALLTGEPYIPDDSIRALALQLDRAGRGYLSVLVHGESTGTYPHYLDDTSWANKFDSCAAGYVEHARVWQRVAEEHGDKVLTADVYKRLLVHGEPTLL